METISRPYRFLLRSYYVVQSSYCVHPIFGGRSGNVAGVMGVLEVIQTGTIRKFGCGFLFAFHSNYGSILHRLRDKAKYWSKIVIFSYALAFGAPVRGIPVGILPPRLVWKN